MEERFQLEVGPLNFVSFLVGTPIAIVMFCESELTKHLDVTLALLLLFGAQFRLLSSLQRILPFSAMLIHSA